MAHAPHPCSTRPCLPLAAIHVPVSPGSHPLALLLLGPFLAPSLPALVGDDALVLLLQVPAHAHSQPAPQPAPVHGVQHVEDVPTDEAEPRRRVLLEVKVCPDVE